MTGSFFKKISDIFANNADLIYPPGLYCISCGKMTDPAELSGLCPDCRSRISWRWDNPYKDVMDELALDDIWTCCRYGGAMRNIMNGLKLSAKTYTAEHLGRLLAERAQLAAEEDGLTLPEHFSAILPVPMFREKERERGYNQARLLAEQAGKLLNIPVRNDLLLKVKESPSMRYASGLERRHAMEGCFSIAEKKRNSIAEKRFILVDDVCTTGSTAGCCASVLKGAGAIEVVLLCAASADG